MENYEIWRFFFMEPFGMFQFLKTLLSSPEQATEKGGMQTSENAEKKPPRRPIAMRARMRTHPLPRHRMPRIARNKPTKKSATNVALFLLICDIFRRGGWKGCGRRSPAAKRASSDGER